MIIKNKYSKEYYNIINHALKQNRSKKNGYFESHHIIPKAMGGSDYDYNRVLLTGQEHYRCHELLPFCTEGKNKDKMVLAWNIMSRIDGKTIDKKLYEKLKIEFSKRNSKPRIKELIEKISGKNSGSWKGYYITPKGKYETLVRKKP